MLVAIVALATGWPEAAAVAQEAPTPEQMLVERFAPVLMLKQQKESCGDGEPYEPVAVDVVLNNPEVALRQIGSGDPVVRWGVSAEELANFGAGFYLDSPGVALDPGCLYETDGRRFNTSGVSTVYARVVPPDQGDTVLVVQYWFYWYFNDWNNRHEADWEGIQLVFDAPDVATALTVEPTSVGYAQHEGGEQAGWDDPKLKREGSRPVVYSSRGSHASYFTSAVYLGRGASTGFGCDDTTGPSRAVDPQMVLLPTLAHDAKGDLAWLTFTGRWGERWGDPYNGPTGPADKERWSDPIGWQQALRDGSITIPGGSGTASQLVGSFCSVVAWGSTQVIELQLNPLRVLVPAALLALGAVWVLRRSRGHLRRGFEAVRAQPRGLLSLGLLGLPVSVAVGVLVWVTRHVPVLDDIMELIDPLRSDSPTRLLGSLLTGGAAIAAAFTVVTAAVTLRLRNGSSMPVRDLVAQVVSTRWTLLAVLVRTALPVTLLAATTLVTALVAQLVVVGAGVVVGVVMLATVTGLPFWTLTMIVTGVGVAVMPWASAVVVGMYDDATA